MSARFASDHPYRSDRFGDDVDGNTLAQTILNSLTAHVAILDEQGFILATNRAWKCFAEENRIQMRPDTLDVNYLEICDRAAGRSADDSDSAAAGIRRVIDGQTEEFVLEYPCHAPDEKRWFYMRVTRAAGAGPLRIVVSHENITALKTAEENLRASERALSFEKHRIEEANTALRVLLRQREVDQQDIEARLLESIQRLVLPLVRRLGRLNLSPKAQTLIGRLEGRLTELTQPFLRHLSTTMNMLTPQEIEVATLIREGYSSKEIAQQLNLSLTTINFHRRNLRRKLNLRHSRTNLRSYLVGLAE